MASLGNRRLALPMPHFARTCCIHDGSASCSSPGKSRSTCMHFGLFRIRRVSWDAIDAANKTIKAAGTVRFGTRPSIDGGHKEGNGGVAQPLPKALRSPRRFEFVCVLKAATHAASSGWSTASIARGGLEHNIGRDLLKRTAPSVYRCRPSGGSPFVAPYVWCQGRIPGAMAHARLQLQSGGLVESVRP